MDCRRLSDEIFPSQAPAFDVGKGRNFLEENKCAIILTTVGLRATPCPTGPHLNMACVYGCHVEIPLGVKHIGCCAGFARIMGA